MAETRIELGKKVEKLLRKKKSPIPQNVQQQLATWIQSVQLVGIEEVRKIPGYHDEGLKGEKEGHRSIRLTRQWRAEYTIENGEVIIIIIVEVHPHDY